MRNRKLSLFISMSLDGFLATTNDDLSWLSIVEREGEDYGYGDFTKDVDTYIVGRKTYDKVVSMIGEFPQASQYKCYVLTRQNMSDKDGITFYNGSIDELITTLKNQEGGTIYCDGGGEVVKELMKRNYIDEYIVSVIPVILGDGKRLFQGGVAPIDIDYIGSKAYDSGLVQLHYKRKGNE